VVVGDRQGQHFDNRDTGLSSPGIEPYSEIDNIAAVMDAASVVSAVLVGVSDGARRALGIAHRYPDRVSRVVASGGTFGDFPDPGPDEAAARREMQGHLAAANAHGPVAGLMRRPCSTSTRGFPH
jgi:pimeloyl-ACP methyl ester carboxylesterase